MNGSDTKLSALQSKAHNLKKDRLWEMLYLHPNNNIVHESKRMYNCFHQSTPSLRLYCQTVINCCHLWYSEPPRVTAHQKTSRTGLKSNRVESGPMELESTRSIPQLGFGEQSTALERPGMGRSAFSVIETFD